MQKTRPVSGQSVLNCNILPFRETHGNVERVFTLLVSVSSKKLIMLIGSKYLSDLCSIIRLGSKS